MRIKIQDLNSSLSSVRGIGSYQQMTEEAINRYGSEVGLEINTDSYEVELITDFNFFQKLSVCKKVPQVLVIHDLIPVNHSKHFPIGIKGKFVWWQNSLAINKLSGIITDSEVVKGEIVNKLKIKPARVQVVYPAVKRIFEKNITAPQPNFVNKLPSRFLLYVGDVTWNKNLLSLAKAVKKTKYTLVLAGSALLNRKKLSHPWLKSFRAFLAEVENSSQFIFTGFVKDQELVWLYQNAQAVTLPSLDEGFGLTWLEAAWLYTPVIVGKTAVATEIVGSAACFVDPKKIDSIARGIERVLSNEKTELVNKQLQRALRYSQKNFASSLKVALDRLIK
jgi:glycosyltransferase involved in cell wall biosynthesis